MTPYYALDQLIGMMAPQHAACSKTLLQENASRLRAARGALSNHHAWRGGWVDHTTEAMNIATLLYPPLAAARPLQFTLPDALVVLFLHDIEKPWKYELRDGTLEIAPCLDTKQKVHEFQQRKVAQYGYLLTPDHQNALRYVEGEIGEYSTKGRKQGPLAAFAHMCDTWSARGWHNYPLEKDDPWSGATRSL